MNTQIVRFDSDAFRLSKGRPFKGYSGAKAASDGPMITPSTYSVPSRIIVRVDASQIQVAFAYPDSERSRSERHEQACFLLGQHSGRLLGLVLSKKATVTADEIAKVIASFPASELTPQAVNNFENITGILELRGVQEALRRIDEQIKSGE